MAQDKPTHLLDMVNTLQGTHSNIDMSHGGTLPIVGAPWAMTNWAPQTFSGAREFFETGGWWFQYEGKEVCGFRATRQPSPWMGDYGQFSLFPTTGPIATDMEGRQSAYDVDASTFKPDYIRIDLKRYNILSEITGTQRCAVMRFTYNQGNMGRLIVDPARESHVEIDGRTIRGYTTSNNGGVQKNWKSYFVIKLDRDVKTFGSFDEKKNTKPDAKTVDGDRIGMYVEFPLAMDSRTVEVLVGTSYIGYEQAETSIKREAMGGFDTVRARTAGEWEKNLSRLQVEGGTLEQRKTFYSCLFRAQTFPHRLYELDANDQPVHFSVYNGKIEKGVLYGDVGFWDIYRTNFGLWSIAFPDQLAEIMAGFMTAYHESGWFPQWPSPGHRSGMIGSHIDAVVADCVTKGIKGFDINDAYTGIRKNAFEVPPMGSVGRGGFKDYAKLGYVPAGKDAGYSVSESLDYAYDDWCVAQVAKKLGKTEDYDALMKASQNYKTLWDPSVGFFRPKNRDGTWFGTFDELAWSQGYVEGGPWQCTWAVAHDPLGMAELMGGPKKMGDKLDQMMGMAPGFKVGGYGKVIHEMTEMAVERFGQYAHSNQPVHHVLYLFSAIGQPWKTQYWTRRVCQDLYNSGPTGFCGDEDNGEMSSWFLLSSMGMFQMCVGDPNYTLTSPLFDKVTIALPGGKPFVVTTEKNETHNQYVQKRTWNGAAFNEHLLSYDTIMQGGDLHVELGPIPVTTMK